MATMKIADGNVTYHCEYFDYGGHNEKWVVRVVEVTPREVRPWYDPFGWFGCKMRTLHDHAFFGRVETSDNTPKYCDEALAEFRAAIKAIKAEDDLREQHRIFCKKTYPLEETTDVETT
jgi:hypothetical protein